MGISNNKIGDSIWLFSDGKTTLCDWVNGSDTYVARELPIYPSLVFDELDRFGIKYLSSKEDDTLLIYDPSCFKMESYTLPLIKYENDEMVLMKRRHTGEAYTFETIEAAKMVDQLFHLCIDTMSTYNSLISILRDEVAVLYPSMWELSIKDSVSNYIDGHKIGFYNFCTKNKAGDIVHQSHPYLALIVDLDKVTNGKVEVKVLPEISIGHLIGKDGWQIQRIRDLFHINVRFVPM